MQKSLCRSCKQGAVNKELLPTRQGRLCWAVLGAWGRWGAHLLGEAALAGEGGGEEASSLPSTWLPGPEVEFGGEAGSSI